MGIVRILTINIVNIVFFVFLCFLTVGFFSNIAAGETPVINPIVIGTIVVLWLSLIINYIVQVKNSHSWQVIILGNIIFLVIVSFVLFVALPGLHRIFY